MFFPCLAFVVPPCASSGASSSLLKFAQSVLATWSQDVAWVGYGFFLLYHHDYAYIGGLYVWWYL